MDKKKVLVWETLATVSGGQKMTLTVLDMLSGQYEFCCLIPAEGMLSEELNKRNIPCVFMGDQTLPTGVKGKKVIFRYAWMSVKNIWKSLGVIRKYKPDILYCPGPAALPWSAVCGSLTGKPVIWHLHHIFLDGAARKLLNICGKWKSVRKIIAVSNCVGDQITENTAHEKVEVLYNPVDFDKYLNGDAAKIRAEVEDVLGLTLDGSQIVIGHVALVQRSKRQDFVLDVIAGLKWTGLSPIGIFAGEAREPEYLNEMKMKAENLGISKQIVYLGRRNDIPDLLKLVDVLMIPSFEGFPLAGLEAAAAGIPVAACAVAGAEEFIRVSGDGACFKEDDVGEAVSTIEWIIDNRIEMSERGRAFAAKMSNAEYAVNIRSQFEAIT